MGWEVPDYFFPPSFHGETLAGRSVKSRKRVFPGEVCEIAVLERVSPARRSKPRATDAILPTRLATSADRSRLAATLGPPRERRQLQRETRRTTPHRENDDSGDRDNETHLSPRAGELPSPRRPSAARSLRAWCSCRRRSFPYRRASLSLARGAGWGSKSSVGVVGATRLGLWRRFQTSKSIYTNYDKLYE